MPVRTRFAICIKNSGYLASLDLRKLYEVIEDPEAEKDDMLRVIDESGEDYLFPSDMFVFAPLAGRCRVVAFIRCSFIERSRESAASA